MLIDNISVFLVLEQNRTPFIDMLLTLAIGLHRLPEVFTIQDYDEKVKTLIQCLLHIQSIETNAMDRVKILEIVLRFPMSPVVASQCTNEYVEAMLRMLESGPLLQLHGITFFCSFVATVDVQLFLPFLQRPANRRRLNTAIATIFSSCQNRKLLDATMELVQLLNGVLEEKLRPEACVSLRSPIGDFSLEAHFQESPDKPFLLPFNIALQESVRFLAMNVVTSDHLSLPLKLSPSFLFTEEYTEMSENTLKWAFTRFNSTKHDALQLVLRTALCLFPQHVPSVQLTEFPIAPSPTQEVGIGSTGMKSNKERIATCTLFGLFVGWIDVELNASVKETLESFVHLLVLYVLEHTMMQTKETTDSLPNRTYSSDSELLLLGPPLYSSGVVLVSHLEEFSISVFLDAVAALLYDGQVDARCFVKHFFRMWWNQTCELFQDPVMAFCRVSGFLDTLLMAMVRYAATERWQFRVALCDLFEDFLSYLPAVWSERVVTILIRVVFDTVKVGLRLLVYDRLFRKTRIGWWSPFSPICSNAFSSSTLASSWRVFPPFRRSDGFRRLRLPIHESSAR